MGVFTHRVVLFPYKYDERDQGLRGRERGDVGDAIVKKGQWEEKWKRDRRPPFWRRCFGSEVPDLPAQTCYADSPHLAESLQRLSDAHSQLYIVGHCEAGALYLSGGTKPGAEESYRVSVKDVYDLIEDRLPAFFCGTIKVYACQSALGFDAQFGGSNPSAGSFAEQFAIRAYGKWPTCKVIGYNDVVVLGGPAKAGPKSGKRVEMPPALRGQTPF
jgi:hypothetical protein